MRPNSNVKSLLWHIVIYSFSLLALGIHWHFTNSYRGRLGLIIGGTFGILYTIYNWHKA